MQKGETSNPPLCRLQVALGMPLHSSCEGPFPLGGMLNVMYSSDGFVITAAGPLADCFCSLSHVERPLILKLQRNDHIHNVFPLFWVCMER